MRTSVTIDTPTLQAIMGGSLICPTWLEHVHSNKGLLTHEAGRGHATPHMPVETAKCWWLLKIEPFLSLKPAQIPSKMGQNL